MRIQIARAVRPRIRSSRSRISAAALLVKVIARISVGFTPCARIRCATRCVRTRVLPDPAPATTRSGPSTWSTASRWAGLRPARSSSCGVTVTAPMLAAASGGQPAVTVPATPVPWLRAPRRDTRRRPARRGDAPAGVAGVDRHGGGHAPLLAERPRARRAARCSPTSRTARSSAGRHAGRAWWDSDTSQGILAIAVDPVAPRRGDRLRRSQRRPTRTSRALGDPHDARRVARRARRHGRSRDARGFEEIAVVDACRRSTRARWSPSPCPTDVTHRPVRRDRRPRADLRRSTSRCRATSRTRDVRRALARGVDEPSSGARRCRRRREPRGARRTGRARRRDDDPRRPAERPGPEQRSPGRCRPYRGQGARDASSSRTASVAPPSSARRSPHRQRRDERADARGQQPGSATARSHAGSSGSDPG